MPCVQSKVEEGILASQNKPMRRRVVSIQWGAVLRLSHCAFSLFCDLELLFEICSFAIAFLRLNGSFLGLKNHAFSLKEVLPSFQPVGVFNKSTFIPTTIYFENLDDWDLTKRKRNRTANRNFIWRRQWRSKRTELNRCLDFDYIWIIFTLYVTNNLLSIVMLKPFF